MLLASLSVPLAVGAQQSLHCGLESVVTCTVCPGHLVRIPKTSLGIHSVPLTLQFQHLKNT